LTRSRSTKGNEPFSKWHLPEPTAETGDAWCVYFKKPPKNSDIYSKMFFFKGAGDEFRILSESEIREQDWEALIGEKPAKRFSNPAAGPNSR
jgi:hypothetical protein